MSSGEDNPSTISIGSSTSAAKEHGLPADSKGRDIFRDTPVRLLGELRNLLTPYASCSHCYLTKTVVDSGYANEVGEAFRSMVSRTAVRATYGVAICYVVADATHKGSIASKTVK